MHEAPPPMIVPAILPVFTYFAALVTFQDALHTP